MLPWSGMRQALSEWQQRRQWKAATAVVVLWKRLS